MYIEMAEAALAAYEKRTLIRGLFSKLAFLLKNGRTRVAILGPGGVGKSTLADEMGDTGTPNPAPVGTYDVSPITEKARIDSVPFGLFYVGPGQARRRAVHWPEILRGISDGTIDGVIFLAAAGFHSFEEHSYKSHASFKEGMAAETWLSQYRDWARAEEIKALDELKPVLLNRRADKRIWMLTLVNKQDIWWDERTQVSEWYQGRMDSAGSRESSAYASRINEVFAQRGNMGFEHEFASVSLESVNFTTKAGEVLKKTVAGYDEVIRAANLKKVDDLIRKLCRIP